MPALHFDNPAPATTTGELTINSQTCHTAAWDVVDASPLWGSATAPRGSQKDLIIPTASGRLGVPRRLDSNRVNLNMAFAGDVDSTGAPTADFWTGLWANWAAFRTALGGVPSVAPVTASLALPGATLTADVIVENLKPGKIATGGTPFMRAVLVVVVLQGEFTP